MQNDRGRSRAHVRLRGAALALLAVGFNLHAQPSVSIVATDPPSGATLPAYEPLFVRLAYDSDSPLRFQASGWLGGAEVQDGASFNPAPVYPAGRGEAVAWVAYSRPTRVDAVHVNVADAGWQTLRRIERRIGVSWAGAAAARERAAWATQLSDEQQAMTSTALAATYGQDAGAPFVLLFFFATASVPGYWALQLYAGLRVRDGWRRAALLPLWPMVPLLAHALFALAAGSNLWPLLLIFASPFALLYLLAVLWLHRRAGSV